MKEQIDALLEVHGDGNCHICGKPRREEGSSICSYPHAMLPIKPVDPAHPEGFWKWERLNGTVAMLARIVG